jgi:hypothetical protein
MLSDYSVLFVKASYIKAGSVVAVVEIVWWLDLQLPMHSVPITTNGVSSNSTQAKCTGYNIM